MQPIQGPLYQNVCFGFLDWKVDFLEGTVETHDLVSSRFFSAIVVCKRLDMMTFVLTTSISNQQSIKIDTIVRKYSMMYIIQFSTLTFSISNPRLVIIKCYQFTGNSVIVAHHFRTLLRNRKKLLLTIRVILIKLHVQCEP